MQAAGLHAALAARDLKRRGKYQPEDFARLRLAKQVDLSAFKTEWLAALAGADAFIRRQPPDEIGCLYYSRQFETFVAPGPDGPGDAVSHYGRPGGVLPCVLEA